MKLERHVAIRHAVGTAAERRRNARTRAELTLWRIVAAAMFAPMIILALHSRPEPTIDDHTRALVRRYAFEAFPQWALVHHEEACPRSIHELSPFLLRAHADDAWGTALELRCGGGIRGAYVRSAGADRRFDTADDITSND